MYLCHRFSDELTCIRERFHYRSEDIVLLTDSSHQHDPKLRPTKSNIIHAMETLVKNAQPGDFLFFHYSGHGGQTEDMDDDEDDKLDEIIYPVDNEEKGFIVDDVRCRYFVTMIACLNLMLGLAHSHGQTTSAGMPPHCDI